MILKIQMLVENIFTLLIVLKYYFIFRKGGLLLINILMAIGGIFLFAAKYANSWEVLAVGRLIIGVNAGLNAGISPMYLSEISPVALRGAVGTVYQLIITISILISQGDIIFKKTRQIILEFKKLS